MKKLDDLLSMNLQFFAENTGADAGGTQSTDNGASTQDDQPDTGEGTDSGSEEAADGKKYTDDEVNAIVNQKYAKWKAEAEHEKEEAVKLSKLNTTEKLKYELDRANKKIAEVKELNAKNEMTKVARKMATDAGINLIDDDLEHIVTPDSDTTKANLDWVKSLHDRIEADIKQRLLKGNAPSSGGNSLTSKPGTLGERLAKSQMAKESPYWGNKK